MMLMDEDSRVGWITMRCFVAIDLPQQVKARLSQLQQAMGGLDRDVRWMKPDQIHLTVKFLGEIPDRRINDVCRILSQLAASFIPFELQVGGTGVFPTRGPARIIWAGIVSPPTALLGFQDRCEEAFCLLDVAREDRPYHPHLTIARVRAGQRAADIIRQVVGAHTRWTAGSFMVHEIVLYQSLLDRSGPTYVPLCRAHCSAT